MTQETAAGGEPPTGPDHPVASDVLAVVSVTEAAALPAFLDRIDAGTHLPGRLILVVPEISAPKASTPKASTPETSEDPAAVLAAHRVRQRLESVRVLRIRGPLTTARAGSAVLDDPDVGAQGARFLWLLDQDCRPAPDALELLLREARSGRSLAVTAPKVRTRAASPTLLSVGYLLTRSGRWLPSPAVGERDQGQHDDRSDVLATATIGSLVDIDAVRRIGGWARSLHGGQHAVAADVDLGWRLHRAGERVVVVPAAVVEVEPGPPELTGRTAPIGTLTPASRRALRQISLGAAPLLLRPVRILTTLATALLTAAVMVLAKRPRSAARELVDGLAVLRLDRAGAAARRFARHRSVPRRALRQLFVPREVARFAVLDDLMPDSRIRSRLTHQDLALRGPRPQAVVHPGFLAVLAGLALTIISGRALGGSLLGRIGWGVSGGEVAGSAASAADLWRSAADAWGGTGLGGPPGWSPALGLLAAATAVAEHLPFVEAPAAPAAATVAGLLFLTLPLAALSMYAALALVTPRRSVRALGGIAWAASGLAIQTVGEGRLGGAIVLIVAPLAAAALVRALGPQGRSYDAAQAGLALAVLAAFAPVVAVFAIAVLVLIGLVPRWSLRRAWGAAVVPLLVLAPFVREVWRDPARGLGGVGLFDWGGAPADPWRLALLDPAGPPADDATALGSATETLAHIVTVLLPWAAVPLLVLAGIGLLRSRHRGATVAALLVAASALAAAIAVNRIVVGTVPLGSDLAGQPIRPWAGSLLAGYALIVIALAARGLDVLSRIGLRRRSVRILTPVAGLGAVLALGVPAAWTGFGTTLSTFVDVRPAVAVDHATGDLAGRTLLIDRLTGEQGADRATAYRIVGAEGALPVRTLPEPVEVSRSVTAFVSRLDAGSLDSPGEDLPGGAAAVLSRHAIGFVAVTADLPADVVRAVDATEGLRRLPDRPGLLWWRVDGSASDAPSPARVVLRTADGDGVSVPSRHHAQTATDVTAGGILEVAQTPAWARTARVSLDGSVLRPQTVDDVVHYTVAEAGRLDIDIATPDRTLRLLAAIAFGAIAYVALPFAAARPGERRRP